MVRRPNGRRIVELLPEVMKVADELVDVTRECRILNRADKKQARNHRNILTSDTSLQLAKVFTPIAYWGGGKFAFGIAFGEKQYHLVGNGEGSGDRNEKWKSYLSSSYGCHEMHDIAENKTVMWDAECGGSFCLYYKSLQQLVVCIEWLTEAMKMAEKSVDDWHAEGCPEDSANSKRHRELAEEMRGRYEPRI